MTTLFASRRSSAVSIGADRRDLAGGLRARRRRRAAAGAEAAGDDADEVAVHRPAHDVGQDRAGGAHQRAGDDQQVVRQHEAGGRRRPARVAVEHRHHDRHVGAADRHDHVDAEQQRDHGHHRQRQVAGGDRVGVDELAAVPDHEQQQREVEPVAPGQQHRLAVDLARQLAEGDHRAREGHRADQDPDVDLELVDGLLGTGELDRGVDVARVADEARGEADQAVHQRDELGHLRHLHGARGVEADAAADDHGPDDPGQARHRDARTEDRRQHGDRHADDAVQVAAARGLGIGQPAEAQDEQDGGGDVGDGGKARGHGRSPTSGTSRACGGSPRSRRTC